MSNIQRNSHIENVAIEWLVKLNRDTVPPELEAEFMAWLQSSPAHQAAYIRAEQLWQRGEVLQKLAQTAAQQPEKANFYFGWQGLSACAAILIVCLCIWLLPSAQQEILHFQTAKGQQLHIDLNDGSKVLLNTNSALDVAYTSSQRTVSLLQGEAFFNVAKDTKRPFDVETHQGTVRVVGTRFAVQHTEADTVITVLEGKVALGDKSDSSTFEQAVLLSPNQQTTFAETKLGLKPKAVDAEKNLSWRKQHLVFRGQPLRDVVEELNRYSNTVIVLGDASLANKNVTAVIQLGEKGVTAETLGSALQLNVTKDNSGRVVLSR